MALLGLLLVPSLANAAEWHEKIKLKGDVRFRNELIRQEDKGDNFRWRVRARLAAEAEINESWSAVIGLATGSDDPVSTNQTLTAGFTRKAFNLDLAYVDFHPKRVPGVRMAAGKMQLPFETADKTQLLWDNDMTPEGVALRFKRAAVEDFDIFMNAAGFYLTDFDPDNEQWMMGAQAGFVLKPSEKVSVMAGAGYFDFRRTKGLAAIYNSGKLYGNSGTKVVVDETTTYYYIYDYNEIEVLGTLDAKLGEKWSLRLAGDYVSNLEADSLNTGLLVGGSISYGKDRGAMRFAVNYRELEADAVLGVFSYSDPWGGGTNGKGLELGFSYGLAKGASFDMTYFVDTKGIKEADPGTDYNRFQADFQVKF